MKDKKLEANLSMVASRVMAGLNMNGLKFLLPLWLGALTGVTVRCVFAAVGSTGVCAVFPYLSQLLPGSGGAEVSQDDGCGHVQLPDIGGDHYCFPRLGAGPFQLDASHCHDLYQRVLC